MAETDFNAASIESILPQSIFAQYPASTGLDLSQEIIVCTPYHNITEYQGTRSALEAEGVIPAGAEWPKGFIEATWEDKNARYSLHRKKPDGVKIPRKQCSNVDWWVFRCYPATAKSYGEMDLERKKKELAKDAYRMSSQGEIEWIKQYRAYREAQKDEIFQAFKALIPGVNRPKRGRKPKNETQESKAN